MSFNWSNLLAEALQIGPGIIADVFADKATMSNESKLAAATQAVMQASQVAKEIDPNDTNTIAAASSGVSAVLSALQTTPPAPTSATIVPVTVDKIAAAAPTAGGASTVAYRIEPSAETISVGETQQFQIVPTPPPGTNVRWAITGNTKGATISQTGDYNSGTAPGNDTITATVNGVATAPATVTVTA